MVRSYEDIINMHPIRVIKTEEENERALKIYEEVLDLYEANPELSFFEDYLDTLVLVIKAFEEKAYQLKKVSGIDALKFFMSQHDLKQQDLTDIFKTQSILSEILNGKRELRLDHIRKLSERFNVPPEVFI